MTHIGLGLSIAGSAADRGPGTMAVSRRAGFTGAVGGLHHARDHGIDQNRYEGKARQRAVSFWVIGSWGGSGLCSFVGGAIATGLGWRWIFVFSIAVALVALMLLRGTPESRSAGAQQQSWISAVC